MENLSVNDSAAVVGDQPLHGDPDAEQTLWRERQFQRKLPDVGAQHTLIYPAVFIRHTQRAGGKPVPEQIDRNQIDRVLQKLHADGIARRCVAFQRLRPASAAGIRQAGHAHKALLLQKPQILRDGRQAQLKLLLDLLPGCTAAAIDEIVDAADVFPAKLG